MAANLLDRETSPYLLQHKDNPVHWMAWGPEAFALARATNRPVLLSVGYAACHWCHVMAHESFEDDAIAGLMNELFVNIKVDREERPDLDQVYQQALALLGQQGGWPLTMFLTPDGQPFWGGTYFPPEARWGRPGFPDVLRGVAATYAKEPEKVSRNVDALSDALAKLARNRPGEAIDIAMLDQVAERFVREIDPFNGGVGDAPKFPQTSLLELLWRAFRRTGRLPFSHAVLNSLTHMAQGGIYDHIGGGFARYSVDERWLVPHFEKMLYDNAQLVDLMTLIWQGSGDRLLRARVEETTEWLLREMVAEGGGFAATLDADSEGVEGKFYVWSKAEIETALEADAAPFCEAYDITEHGNWEETNIPNRLSALDLGDEAHEAKLADLRGKLLAVRAGRVRPGWDDKVLADWNGLAIAALARAGLVFDRPDWIAAARRAFDFVAGTMQREGRLFHSWRHGQLKHAGTLDDHAAMARAALLLFEATGDEGLVSQAGAWADICERHFRDPEGGGYFISADDALDLPIRPRHAHDNAVPSGNGLLLAVQARLWHLTGEAVWRDRADALVAAFSGELARNFFPLSTYLNAVELLLRGVQVVVVGPPASPGVRTLITAALSVGEPNLVLTPLAPGADLPSGHPAAGKGMIEGKPTAYVCRAMACAPPVTEPDALVALLGAG